MYKIYLYKEDFNEATSFYIDIIRKSLVRMGENVDIVYSLDLLNNDDVVITIQAMAFAEVWLRRNRKRNIINWYQGIVPEEAMCLFEKSISRYFRYWLWCLLERIALKNAKRNIFVSEAMLTHYQQKYNYKKENYFIMPCFNQELRLSSFSEEKYRTPSFVYAGSLSRWQCVEETLVLYKGIKRRLPDASLTILTKEIDKAKMLCDKYEVEATVKFVPSAELQDTLSCYKYGFIVRDDIAVNNVATPTKMNSYMAAGVIPVFSDVIYDFKKNFYGLKYVIPFLHSDEAIEKILKIEKNGINCEDIKFEYKKIFDSYYSTDCYIEPLGHFLQVNGGTDNQIK